MAKIKGKFQGDGDRPAIHLLATFGGATGTGAASAQTVHGLASGSPTVTLGKACVIVGLVTSAAAAPGSSKTYVAAPKIAGTASAVITATISGASATDASTWNRYLPVAATESIGAQFTATGTPSDVKGTIQFYGYFVE